MHDSWGQLFYGSTLVSFLEAAIKRNKGATILGYRVEDVSEYGVINFNKMASKSRKTQKL